MNSNASALEKKVEEIWKNILNVPDGMEDSSFFELNGESISALRIVSRVEEELGIAVDVGDIFEDDPNLREFTRSVAASADESSLA